MGKCNHWPLKQVLAARKFTSRGSSRHSTSSGFICHTWIGINVLPREVLCCGKKESDVGMDGSSFQQPLKQVMLRLLEWMVHHNVCLLVSLERKDGEDWQVP